MNNTVEDKLFEEICRFKNDPLGFVNYVFPWREEGTILEKEDGPDTWQVEILNVISNRYSDGIFEPLRIAVASGHRIGKTALISWIILWFMSTRINPQIVVTANTKTQLDTKTWREVSKWHQMIINRYWFKWTATKFYAVQHPSTWYASAIPWSEHNSEAFAGTQEQNVLVLYDEASNIPDVIWEVTSGAMLTPSTHGNFPIWIAFGNPTRNTGGFKKCFSKERHRWITRQIDSRTAKMANKDEIEEWIKEYGEDSDYIRVRARGQFPRASSLQFISLEDIEKAATVKHEPDVYKYAPISIGVDIARFGDDQTVICVRQGFKVHELKKFRELDTNQVAYQVASFEDKYRSLTANITVYVDLGYNPGVYDRLVEIGRKPIGIHFGGDAAQKSRYRNKRTEMWDDMRKWLREGGQIIDDQELKDDLIGPEYSFTEADRIVLERKKDMKARGVPSPDCGDALALTFAMPMRYDFEDGYEDDYLNYSTIPVSNSPTGY